MHFTYIIKYTSMIIKKNNCNLIFFNHIFIAIWIKMKHILIDTYRILCFNEIYESTNTRCATTRYTNVCM